MGEKRIRRVALVPPVPTLPSGDLRKRRVAAYARVSTASDEQENSLAAQRTYYENRIRSNMAWEFVEVYYDDGVSGLTSRNRDGFNQMVTDAIAGKIDLILTKSLSRFARNTVDTLTTIRRLKEYNVEVFFEKENIYTFDSKGEFLITLMSSIAQEESRSLSENVTWGFRKRFADGKYTMPYKNFLGYQKGSDGKPKIDEDEAFTIRLIYLLFLEGFTLHRMELYLNAIGLPSPMDKRWDAGVISSILRNEKYKGVAVLQKTVTVDYLTKKRKTNEGEAPKYYLENAHPAIVSADVWDMVQEEAERRGGYGNRYSAVHNLAGKIVCERCGSFYGLKSTRRSGVFYGMFWRCNRFYENECESPTILEEAIDDYCKLAIGDLFEYHRDVLEYCSTLLSSVDTVSSNLASVDNLREWFINQVDYVNVDRATIRSLIHTIHPVSESYLRFCIYDGVELSYQANKKGKKLQNFVREMIDNRATHFDIPSPISPAQVPAKRTGELTDADKARIQELRIKGGTYKSIADEIGISATRVRVYCVANGLGGTVYYNASAVYVLPVRPKIRITDDIWTKVYALRIAGYSIKEIHDLTGINQDTIKSRCHRYGLTGNYTLNIYHNICKNCGKPLEHVEGKKKKEFCCDNCRAEWWSLQRRAEKIKAEFLEKKS